MTHCIIKEIRDYLSNENHENFQRKVTWCGKWLLLECFTYDSVDSYYRVLTKNGFKAPICRDCLVNIVRTFNSTIK